MEKIIKFTTLVIVLFLWERAQVLLVNSNTIFCFLIFFFYTTHAQIELFINYFLNQIWVLLPPLLRTPRWLRICGRSVWNLLLSLGVRILHGVRVWIFSRFVLCWLEEGWTWLPYVLFVEMVRRQWSSSSFSSHWFASSLGMHLDELSSILCWVHGVVSLMCWFRGHNDAPDVVVCVMGGLEHRCVRWYATFSCGRVLARVAALRDLP